MVASLGRDLAWGSWKSLGALAALTVLAAAVLRPAFDILPFDGDNFYVLSWADRAGPASLLQVDPSIYPEWRPLAYLTVWLQYQRTGLGTMTPYFVVNLLAIVACAWLVFRIVLEESGAAASGLVVAALALTDQRVVRAMSWIVERQSSMACLFGLAALLLVSRAGERRLSPAHGVVVGALLLASPLCKEYGLAFLAGVGIDGALRRRRDLVAIAATAFVGYAALRLVVVRGALQSPDCSPMGYFFSTRAVCIGAGGTEAASQMLYNVAATAVGSVLPGLFSPNGQVGVSLVRLGIGAAIAALAAWGWWAGSRTARMALLTVAANAVLSASLYRERNQFIASFAVAVAAGCGLARWTPTTVPGHWAAIARRAAFSGLLAAIALQAVRTHDRADDDRTQFLSGNPCRQLQDRDQIDRRFGRRLMAFYALPDAGCAYVAAPSGVTP